MPRQFIPIILLLLLLLAILSPFSALAGLLLLIVGNLLYGLAIALLRACAPVEPDQAEVD